LDWCGGIEIGAEFLILAVFVIEALILIVGVVGIFVVLVIVMIILIVAVLVQKRRRSSRSL
jgi:hypothetical protein